MVIGDYKIQAHRVHLMATLQATNWAALHKHEPKTSEDRS